MQGTPSTQSGKLTDLNVNKYQTLLHTITVIVLQSECFLLDGIYMLQECKITNTPSLREE